MSSEVQVFENETFGKIRVIVEGDEFSFVASDIARATGYHDAAHMVRYLNDDEKGYKTITTPGGEQRVLVINEPGLYHVLAMRQTVYVKDPKARAYLEGFQHWAYHVVFPTIRAKGYYINPAYANPAIAPTREEKLAEAVLLATEVNKEKEQRIKALEAENEEMRPKAAFADAITDTKDGILVRTMANILTQNGYPTGEKRLYAEFRKYGFIQKQKGKGRNLPTQKSMERGLMVVREFVVRTPKGDFPKQTTYITGKGQRFFYDFFITGRNRPSLPSSSEESGRDKRRQLPPGEEMAL